MSPGKKVLGKRKRPSSGSKTTAKLFKDSKKTTKKRPGSELGSPSDGPIKV